MVLFFDEEVYVIETDSNRFDEVLVNNPIAVILKNAKPG